jgi:hypothetical protein
MAQPPPQTAQLVYDAAQELLSGAIGKEKPFNIKAYSGGSRGHKAVKPAVAVKYLHNQAATLPSRFANTPEITEKKGNYLQRGGTLPAGHYTCHYLSHHHIFGECIRLDRQADAKAIHSPFSPFPIPHGRGNDFFIHGSGPKGSDGCIVPALDADRRRLNHAVKTFSGKVVLLVKHVSYRLPAELEGQLA